MHTIKPTASYFCEEDLWLYSNMPDCFFTRPYKTSTRKCTPLPLFDVTVLSYVKTIASIAFSAPKNPILAIDSSSISYILQISYQTIVDKSPLDTLTKVLKNVIVSAFIPLLLLRTPSPPITML